MRAKITYQIERTRNENGIIFTSYFGGILERLDWVGNDGRALRRQVSRHFSE